MADHQSFSASPLDATVLAQPSTTAVPVKTPPNKLNSTLTFLLQHRLVVIVAAVLSVGLALGVGLGVGLRDKDVSTANTMTVAATSLNIQLRLAGATCSQQYLDSAVAALKASLQARPGVAPASVVVNVAKCTEVQSTSSARRMLAVTGANMDMATTYIITDLTLAKQMQSEINSLAANPNTAAADVCASLPGLCTALQAQGLNVSFGSISMSYQEIQVPTSSVPSPSPAASAPAASPSAAPPSSAALPDLRGFYYANMDDETLFEPVIDPLAHLNMESSINPFFDEL